MARVPLLVLAIDLLGVWAAHAAFSVAWTAPLSDDNRGAAWADFNNDCRPDFVLVNNQPVSCVRVYRNDGGDSFTLVYTSTQEDRCTAVAAADYDGDGLVDFAVSNYSQIPSRIYHNNGTFNFSVAWSQPVSEYSTGIDWGDYDNDGRPDLAVNSLSVSGVRLYHNDGGNSFGYAGMVSTSGNAASTRFADYDNDGFLDIFEGVTGWGSVIWKGNGTVGFVSACTLPWNNNSDSDWEDFDGDGSLDLIQTSYVTIHRNAGGGSFPTYWTSGESQYVRAADYDADGLPDYATAHWASHEFYVVHNDGGGSFVTIACPSASGGPVAWADYDGDGGPDVLGGVFQGPYEPAVVYHNDGTGFVPLPCLTGTPTPSPVWTHTASSTPTIPGTPTETLNPTDTGTPTFSGTATYTPTNTWSPTQTPTYTDTDTPTQTLSPTRTFSPTPSFTPADTSTETLTFTITWTPTPTDSPTWTFTPTDTRTPTETPTATDTPTSTLTPTVTNTVNIPVPDELFISSNAVERPGVALISLLSGSTGRCIVVIYNSAGERVRILFDARIREGNEYEWVWDLKNDRGDRVSAGVYIIHLTRPRGISVLGILVL